MSHELHYTSAPKGLKPGSRGYCTVACTAHLPTPLADRLEGLSGYRQVFAPHDPASADNPVVYSHVRLSLGGQNLSVLSRVAAAGLDYTDRSNKYAHHVVLDASERPPAGPAWVASQPGFFDLAWSGEPRLLPAGRRPPQGDHPPGVCHAWAALAGDPGWAGRLAESFLDDPKRIAYLVFQPGQALLPLFVEAVALIPPRRRWEVGFSTYLTTLPQGLECAWRGVLSNSPEAAQARRTPGALLIDLTAPLPDAQGGDLVALARTGVVPRNWGVEPPPPRVAPAAPPTRREAHRPAAPSPPPAAPPLPSDELYEVIPDIPTPGVPPQRLGSRPGPRTPSPRPSREMSLAIGALLIFAAGLFTGWMIPRSAPDRPEPKTQQLALGDKPAIEPEAGNVPPQAPPEVAPPEPEAEKPKPPEGSEDNGPTKPPSEVNTPPVIKPPDSPAPERNNVVENTGGGNTDPPNGTPGPNPSPPPSGMPASDNTNDPPPEPPAGPSLSITPLPTISAGDLPPRSSPDVGGVPSGGKPWNYDLSKHLAHDQKIRGIHLLGLEDEEFSKYRLVSKCGDGAIFVSYHPEPNGGVIDEDLGRFVLNGSTVEFQTEAASLSEPAKTAYQALGDTVLQVVIDDKNTLYLLLRDHIPVKQINAHELFYEKGNPKELTLLETEKAHFARAVHLSYTSSATPANLGRQTPQPTQPQGGQTNPQQSEGEAQGVKFWLTLQQEDSKPLNLRMELDPALESSRSEAIQDLNNTEGAPADLKPKLDKIRKAFEGKTLEKLAKKGTFGDPTQSGVVQELMNVQKVLQTIPPEFKDGEKKSSWESWTKAINAFNHIIKCNEFLNSAVIDFSLYIQVGHRQFLISKNSQQGDKP